VLEHPAYSPDLSPSDFFLFPKLKEILKGRHFKEIGDLRSNTTAALKAIPQYKFQNCFEGLSRRWHCCISSQGGTLKATTVVFSKEVYSNFTAMCSRNLLFVHVVGDLGGKVNILGGVSVGH
jgi:histone-lysine N-methyltransferase SETMAR